jgi:threonine dehydratase
MRGVIDLCITCRIVSVGTIALELLEQVPELDVIVVPIGGGGMCSGK